MPELSLYQWNIAVHATCATFSVVLGGFLMWGTKGKTAHRYSGWAWVAAMLITAGTGFGIADMGGLSWLHGLAAFTLYTVSRGAWAARKGDLKTHRGNMLGTYIGLSLAALGALIPGRRIMDFLLQ